MRFFKGILWVFFVMIILFSCNSIRQKENIYTKKSHVLINVKDTALILPPSWAFGVLYGGYTNQHKTIETIQDIQNHDYPIDVYWIDSWFWDYQNKGKGPKKYIDFIADTVSYPSRKAMWQFMKENHIKGGFWIWDCILERGNEEAYSAFDSLGYFSSKFLNTNPWHNNSTTTAMFENSGENLGTWCGNIDFDNVEAVNYFKQRMKPFFNEGADFLKLDRTSEVKIVKTMFEISQELGLESHGRGFVLSHSGDTKSGEFKKYPTKWTDDTRSDWTIENPTKAFNSWVPNLAFKENIALYTTGESSNIPFLTNDTGGFDKGNTDILDEELYIRWLEFSVFTPVMEVFSQPENPTGNLAYKYSQKADDIFKKYTHFRMELFPYIYSYAIATRVEGKNIIRPIQNQPYEYLLGNEFLIAPVYEQGAVYRKLHLPEGTWIDYYNLKEYKGNETVTVEAPLDKIPVFVRKGSVIPMRNYSSHIETGSNDTIHLHVFPGKDSSFNFYEDDGKSNDYLKGILALTKIDFKVVNNNFYKINICPTLGSFNDFPTKRVWKIIIHDENFYKITVNDKRLSTEKKGNLSVSEYFVTDYENKCEIELNKKSK